MTSVDDKMNKWNKVNTSLIKNDNFVASREHKEDSDISTLIPIAVLRKKKKEPEYISDYSDITINEYVNYLDNLNYDDTKIFSYNDCNKYMNDDTNKSLLKASIWCQYWRDLKYKEEQILLQQEQESETSDYGSDDACNNYSKFDYV